MKTIYFVRHGETEFNQKKTSQGPDSSLNKTGIEQAYKIAERAKNLPIELIVSSTYPRAKQTAEIIQEKINLSPEYSELFVERKNPSVIIGKKYNDPEAIKIKEAVYQGYTDPDFRHSDEETFQELKSRALAGLNFLKNKSENNILVVTHGMFLKVLVATTIFGKDLQGKELYNFIHHMHVTNTSITAICYDETRNIGKQWYVWVWNDHAHLG